MKKVCICILAVLVILAVGFYVAVPIIARGVIAKQLLAHPSNSFEQIDISWGGPQLITRLHIEDSLGSGDVDVTIENSLFSLVLGIDPIEVIVTGDAIIRTTKPEPIATGVSSSGTESNSDANKRSKKKSISVPAMHASITLETVTLVGDETIVLRELLLDIDLDPGMHFVATLSAISETEGSIEVLINAPNLISKNGMLDLSTSATCKYTFVHTPIPSINGIGGWSIVKLAGEISSPNLEESVSIRTSGTLAEYDTPRGEIWVKAQLLHSDTSASVFIFNYDKIDGVAELNGVPTTILSPLLSTTDIRINRDLGPVMDVQVLKNKEDSNLGFQLKTEHILATGFYNSQSSTLSETTLQADVHSDLLSKLTNEELSGSGKAVLHIDQYVLNGTSRDDKPECSGDFSFTGKLLHAPSKTSIENFQSDFSAQMRTRSIGMSGTASLNGTDSKLSINLIATTKNKLHKVEDLWKTITKRLPKGTGQLTALNIPSSLVRGFVTNEQFEIFTHFGNPLSANVVFIPNGFRVECGSPTSEMFGNVALSGNEIKGIDNAELHVQLNKQSASELFGIAFNSPSTFHAIISTADMQGNSAFTLTYDVGKQHLFTQGTTTRQEDESLDLHVACTGIDTKLLDAVLKCDGILADSLGSPIAMEAIVSNILDEPIIRAGGTAPNAVFETELHISDGALRTAKDIPTAIELHLSPELTQHLLKDLGPVLSDIRSVSHPIRMTILNASSSLDSDVSKLNAVVQIDIGKVKLDSGSITMKLLPMFNSTHTKSIPATFDPIRMDISNGIITYKEFHLTLDTKYSIPYSGTINLVNRNLHLKSAVPLTGLGYSIKELRGLATDIDVPILITGTIDTPIAQVDPNFDLGKLLQSAALSALGDAIGGVLGGDKENQAPNPLDLLDELFGD